MLYATFKTQEMTRLLVLEQIYRAYMIRHHRPYHK